jgi:GTPase SAR1 family protein
MSFVHHSFQARREQLSSAMHRLGLLTTDIGQAGLAETINDLRLRIYDPFLFVIVGEVKAGKSSFINALLDTGGREICKVAPQPMTDTIQQITWGETETIDEISPYLKRITLPIESLREIAIVDTPGTNTIVAHHQEITERFVPAADLIIFVFEGKNPYRQSAWDFFDYIHGEWRRKVIFVLQQKDLMPESDLAVNLGGVIKQAADKGLNDARVFAVSAKDELEGRFDSSGFSAMRDYIKTHVTGGKAPGLKLVNLIGTASDLANRVRTALDTRQERLVADKLFRDDIRKTLDDQEIRSQKEVILLLDNILSAYDRHTTTTERNLSDGLSFPMLLTRSIKSIFGSSDSPKGWLEGLQKELETNLNRDLPLQLQESVTTLSESIQQMARIVDLKIRQSSTALRDDHDIFSDIAERRSQVLKDLQDTFARFLNRSESFTDEQLFVGKGSIAPQIATGGGIAVIGVVLAALTQGSVLDVTGGVLTGVGLLLTGVTASLGRNKIINSYRTEIARGRAKLNEEITENLHRYIRHIKQRIDHNFDAFDRLIASEEEAISSIGQRLDASQAELDGLRNELLG